MNGFISLSGPRKIACVALTTIIVGGTASAIALQRPTSTTPDNTIAAETAASLASARAASEAAYEERHATHAITLTIAADGWDTSGSDAAIMITGTDQNGKTVMDKAALGCGTTTSIAELTDGSYLLTLLTPPVLVDGSTYDLPACVTFTVNGSSVTLTLTLTKADLTTMTDEDFATLTATMSSTQVAAVTARRANDIAAATGTIASISSTNASNASSHTSSNGGRNTLDTEPSPSDTSTTENSSPSEQPEGGSSGDSSKTQRIVYYCGCGETFSSKEEVVEHIDYYRDLWLSFKISDDEMDRHTNWGWYYVYD
jgi:hypothetical protein